MPEGDTIHRTANRLRPALASQPVVHFDAQRLTGNQPRVGDVIESVEAVGKNLLIRFPERLVLHTHMKMTGSWHLYRPDEKWQKDPKLARVVLEVPDWVAVCFSAPVVRTWIDVAGSPNPLSPLGPDLCLADPDIDLIVDRIAALAEPGTSIADVLLNQQVAAGIGNVYKSEALWACNISPFLPIEHIDQDMRRQLFRTAGRQLRANLTTPTRTTVPGGLAVYGRNGRPCRRCRTTIRSRAHGDQARVTYWCPVCQDPR